MDVPGEGVLVAPVAGFFSTAAMLCEPLPSGGLGVMDQLPLASTTVEPMGVPPSVTMTMSPGLPLPEITGLGLPVVPPEGTLPPVDGSVMWMLDGGFGTV